MEAHQVHFPLPEVKPYTRRLECAQSLAAEVMAQGFDAVRWEDPHSVNAEADNVIT